MKPLTALLLLGGAYLLYRGATSALSVRGLTFGIADADISCSGILCTQPELQIGLRVQNPGPGDFTLNSMAGNFSFNGVYAGNVSAFQQMELPPHSEIVYPVKVRVTLATLIGNLGNLFEGGIRGEIGIDGTVNVSGIPVPVVTTYRIV